MRHGNRIAPPRVFIPDDFDELPMTLDALAFLAHACACADCGARSGTWQERVAGRVEGVPYLLVVTATMVPALNA